MTVAHMRMPASLRALPAAGLALALAVAPATPSQAGEPGPQDRAPVPVTVFAPPPQTVEPAAAVSRSLVPEPAFEVAPPQAISVTYAQAVGYFSRHGYEATKRDAHLYCAQYGRLAMLDVRFRINDEWYVRFDCIMPR